MANATSAIGLSDLSLAQIAHIEQNVSFQIGVASLNLTSDKTHAIAKVTFKKSYTEARLLFTRDQILNGWPKVITERVDFAAVTPGFWSGWSATIASDKLDSFYLENPDLRSEFHDKWRGSVQHATLTFDSETTYESSLLKSTIVPACKAQFPNLRSYSLVFSSI